ncbi:MAG: D-alanyl-D-alanine carboxypeptidase family protein [Bacillota bacterium]
MKLNSKTKLQWISYLIISIIFFTLPVTANNPDFKLQSKSAVLMEYKSGKIIYQNNAREKLPPASITKIMTMLLVMEALEEGGVGLNDSITVSSHAASMGGSQVWLEPGEEMKLANLLKAVAIVSANDACVALAEYISGTEQEFVEQMNHRATELGMKNTKFYNTNGLPSDNELGKENYTTAYDVALMTRELLKYSQILEYTSVWIDHLRAGESFLRNTNELVRFYEGADGIKTGYTTEAGFCLSATAQRKGMRFIAVIMKGPTSKVRFKESKELLSYAFNIHNSFVIAKPGTIIDEVKVFKGKEDKVAAVAKDELIVAVLKGNEDSLVKRTVLKKQITAPVRAGDDLGEIIVLSGENKLGAVELIAQNNVKKANFLGIISNLWVSFLDKLIAGR